MKLKEILSKIESLEKDLIDINNIITIEFHSDYNGSIHSHDCEYFSFEELSDLKTFIAMNNDYIIRNRIKY